MKTGLTSVSAGSPHLRRQGDATQLVVDGRPMLMLAGELGNSSSDLDHLRDVWPRLVKLGLNTVLAPVYWDRLEPAESEFDFSLIDGLVEGAREHRLRLVPLWFGSWKNSMSCYAPAWVKRDPQRFPRARTPDGRPLEILSPFFDESGDADARAFAALMRRIARIDRHHTVVMVQVENEIGMIPHARDHHPRAQELFAADVPPELGEALGLSDTGPWERVFGPGTATAEKFMAWHFARYVEHVAAAGRAVHDVPLFVNAALMRPGHEPGRYPSAGPLPQVFDIWRAAAPSIDVLAPDIYFPNYVEWIARYRTPDNPLLIPEIRRQPSNAAEALYAFAEHDAMMFSPFAIEHADPQTDPLAAGYAFLRGLAPLVLQHQGRRTMRGLLRPIAFEGAPAQEPAPVPLGGYRIHTRFDHDDLAGGLVILTEPDTFLIAGRAVTCTFEPADDTGETAGILDVQLGACDDAGAWIGGRWLNGDQTHQGRHVQLPADRFTIQRVRLYRYR